MTFTPEQVESQEFLGAFRGYDKKEVRNFLTVLADQMRVTEKRAAALEQGLANAGTEHPPPPVDLQEAAGLAAELSRHLATAVELIEDLNRASEKAAVAGPPADQIPAPESSSQAPPDASAEGEPEAEPSDTPEPERSVTFEPERGTLADPPPAPSAPYEPASVAAPQRRADRTHLEPPPEWEDLLADPPSPGVERGPGRSGPPNRT